jgi:N-acylneuraminate cytidylyltransferase/CMP-N,N'-diacetyllegionaminic acid synthase
MKILAIIPARGGSKGVPRKNVCLLAGKPLIAWTIEAAKQSDLLDRIVLSTDAEYITEVAQTYGINVPFLRPVELAQEDTPGIAPVLHAVSWLEQNESYYPDYVLVLQPTSPFRTSSDIDAAIRLAQQNQADGVVSVVPVHQHPYWTKCISDDGRLVDFLPLEKDYPRRQDLPPVYALNGAIYLVKREVLLEQQTYYTERTFAYIMPPERSLDIDTSWDLYLAGLIFDDRYKHGKD